VHLWRHLLSSHAPQIMRAFRWDAPQRQTADVLDVDRRVPVEDPLLEVSGTPTSPDRVRISMVTGEVIREHKP
jgi:hypothetical protein